MNDPRIDLLHSLNVSQIRIKKFPGFVFICGGPVPKAGETRPFQSLRHQLLEHLKAGDINLGAPLAVAERFGQWLHFDTYDDLITFERHLAGLANLIPIILESAGAIAEFGAFSQEQSIKAKLLVFRGNHFAEDESFINFGLIKFMEREYGDCVQTYPWLEKAKDIDPNEVDEKNSSIVADIAEDIRSRVTLNLRKTYKFRPDDPGHVMILIEDLIKLMIGLRLDEIVDFLNTLGVTVDNKTVRQYLFLLGNVKVIGDRYYGARYYFSKNIWNYHIDYAFKPGGALFDRGSFMRSLEEFYRSGHDKRLSAARGFFSSQARGA